MRSKQKRARRLHRRIEKRARREERLNGAAEPPTKSEDEVFMSGKRNTYHEHWCSAVNGVWLSGSNNLRVEVRAEAIHGGAVECTLCAEIGELQRLDTLDARYA